MGASSPSGQLDGFVGDATCTGNMTTMGKNPGHATTGRLHGDTNGKWVKTDGETCHKA